MDFERRRFMKSLMAGSALTAVAAGSSLMSLRAWATDTQEWPKKAFNQKHQDEAIKALYGKTAKASDKIKLSAPDIAENGAVVPVTIDSSLPNVTHISVVVPKNPYALAASFDIPKNAEAFVSNRFKMAKTSDLVALVESDGKLYKTSKHIKVTVGGCGG